VKTCLLRVLRRPLENAGDVVGLPGSEVVEVVVERDADARPPGKPRDGEGALLGPELGAVEGLQADGSEVRTAPDPRVLEAPHHVVAHGIAWTTSGLAGWWLGGRWSASSAPC